VRTLGAQIGDVCLRIADFSHLPTHCRFIALMPQWDFLNFIARQAKRCPAFQLRMEANVTALIEEGGRVAGVQAETAEGSLTVRADLVVGADGRHSTVRAKAGLETLDLGAPMDVLWMRLSPRPTDPEQTLGRIDAGRILVRLNREDYWQCAFVIPKGGFERVHRAGLASFREEIIRLAPYLRDRVGELGDWSDIKLLTVAVDRLRNWHRPACCASAMPPTPCPRSAASASISQFRMPSPRPTSWRRLFCAARFPTTISGPFSAGGNFPPGRCKRCRSSCRTG
jgi:2-polyprenyl-6-methoxyphenol hydroxylase-like FAD-dependent oxidoreductase